MGSASVTLPGTLTCEQLDAIIERRDDVSPTDLEPELEQEKQAQADLKAALQNFPTIVHVADKTPGLRGVSRGGLEHDLSDTSARIRRLTSEIAGVGGVSTALNSLIRNCASQPTPPTTTTPPPPTTTTTPPSPTTPTVPPSSPSADPVDVTQTDSTLNQDMASQPALAFSTAAPSNVPVIDVNDQLRYQQFSGLGAAMTDSSAWLIYDNLSPASRLTLMQDLFSSEGIHLNFLRVPMGASDFTVSAMPYTYDDVPAGQSDPSLSQFSIAHDLPYIIPTLQQALQINPGLQISANPWSPPAWMKANDSLDNTNLQGTLLTSAYGPLANYFVKFIQAYESAGVPIDIIVPQNEPRSPGGSGTSYPGLTLPEADEATFIAQYLQPALTAAGLAPKIYGNDLSWDKLSYAQPLASSSAGSDLSGIAWHCYAGTSAVMSQLQQADPNLDQIVDECSPEIRNFGAPEYLISALRNWASEAAVWNVALDPQGGPKQTSNGCPGCIGLVTINEQTQAFSFNTEYYQLGQVSAFVQPGAVRIDSPNFVTYGTNSSNIETVTSGLDDVAFLNPDGSKVLIANNNSTAPISFAVESDGSYFSYTIPADAMTTFTWS
jgi:glucosylceramidase